MMIRIALITAMMASLSACGLQPLYSGGTQGVVAQQLGQVVIDPIEGQAGWLVRNELSDQLAPVSGDAARYRLVVRLDDRIEGFGVIANDIITRERRSLRARYQLVDIVTGETVLDATAGSDAGIDVVSSEYATIAAENTALENLSREVSSQIVTRLSLFAREQ